MASLHSISSSDLQQKKRRKDNSVVTATNAALDRNVKTQIGIHTMVIVIIGASVGIRTEIAATRLKAIACLVFINLSLCVAMTHCRTSPNLLLTIIIVATIPSR